MMYNENLQYTLILQYNSTIMSANPTVQEIMKNTHIGSNSLKTWPIYFWALKV